MKSTVSVEKRQKTDDGEICYTIISLPPSLLKKDAIMVSFHCTVSRELSFACEMYGVKWKSRYTPGIKVCMFEKSK